MAIPFSGTLDVREGGGAELALTVRPPASEVARGLAALKALLGPDGAPLVPQLALVEAADVRHADVEVRLALPLHPTVRVVVEEDGAG